MMLARVILPAGLGAFHLTLVTLRATPCEHASLPTWNAQRLSGSRAGTWSMHVTRNWRLTFWIDTDDAAVCDIDFEDYH